MYICIYYNTGAYATTTTRSKKTIHILPTNAHFQQYNLPPFSLDSRVLYFRALFKTFVVALVKIPQASNLLPKTMPPTYWHMLVACYN